MNNFIFAPVNWARVGDEKYYKNLKEVESEFPAAVKIVKVEGGWVVFETWPDYVIWTEQK